MEFLNSTKIISKVSLSCLETSMLMRATIVPSIHHWLIPPHHPPLNTEIILYAPLLLSLALTCLDWFVITSRQGT